MRNHSLKVAPPGALAASALLAALLGFPGEGGAQTVNTPAEAVDQACPGAVIRHVFVDNHSIFNTAVAEEDGQFLWLYRAANWIHPRTRSGFIRNELLFRPGDCLNPLRLAESERILRAYPFIAEVDIYSVDIGTGDVHVVVDTEDEWTTEVAMRLDLDNGLRFTRLGITEGNFLGTGNRVGVFLRERDERRDIGVDLFAPRFLGTRTNATLTAGSTRNGAFFSEQISYPFVGEFGRYAALESYSNREDLFAYAASGDAAFTNVVVPIKTERAEVTAAARVGTPGDFTVVGAGFSWEKTGFLDFPNGVRVIPGQDFSEQLPADSATVAALAHQVTDRETPRIHVLVGRRKIRFVSKRGLDAIRGEQDVRVGTQVLGSLGTTLGIPSTDLPGASEEVWGRLALFGGAAGDHWVLNTDFNLEAGRLFTGGLRPGAFRDALGEVNVFAYWQPPGSPAHTLAGRIAFAGGWNSSIPFQLTLGGRDGVRGYSQEDFPGGQRFVFNFEDRIRLSGPFSNALDLGFTVFADAGAVWAGDAPFGVDSGIQAAVGMGLRVGFPSGTSNVIRLDLAAPIQAGGLSNVQFRVSMRELVSLLPGLGDFQLLRSRAASPDAGIVGIRPGG
ncbi:MAG: hypothetical protein ACR2QM_14500 [Longimicrobiales bacterium]